MWVAPQLDPAKALIGEMLRGNLSAPRKQRHTARKILARLVDEHDMVDLSFWSVWSYVAKPSLSVWGDALVGV